VFALINYWLAKLMVSLLRFRAPTTSRMEKQSTRSYQLFYTQIWKKSALANNAEMFSW
jgi:hypothetical protein